MGPFPRLLARLAITLALPLLLLTGMVPAYAMSPSGSSARPHLRVGTKEAPPFVVRRADGTLGGPSLRLWRDVAEDLGVDYTLEERDLAGLLEGVRDGSLDAATAAITVTSEREATIDFSHPFHTAGLGIAAPRHDDRLWVSVLATLFSADLLRLVGFLAVLQLAVGTVVWLLERKTNTQQFPKGPLRGLFSGFWWSVVTMTTVGYGDKTPRSGAGRVVALGWMLCSVVIISTFTATVASRMTLREIDSDIAGPADLQRLRVGVVGGTTSDRWARAQGLDFGRFADVESALAAAETLRVDVVVHDAPLLQLALDHRSGTTLELLPPRFQRQDYAIALPEGSEWREPINRLLPERLRLDPVGEPQLSLGGR